MQSLSSSTSSSSTSSSSTSGGGSRSYCAAALSTSRSPLSATTLSSSSSASSALLSPLPRQPRQATKKRVLAFSDDPTEALVEHVKKCRVSSTPGELRLKKDLVDCDLLQQQGIARFDKTPGNPLKCQLTFLRPIERLGVATPGAGGTARRARRVPTTFSIVVPKFYPHDPPTIFAERCFRRTCSFVGEDGQLHLPFLEKAAWSSISTMAFVVETLLQGLEKYAAGEPQLASEAAELNAAEQRTQHPEEERRAPTLSAAAGAGARFASSGNLLLRSLAPSEGVRRDGGGGDEWAMEAQWNAKQLSGGHSGRSDSFHGSGDGSGNGSGALNRTPSIFAGQPGGDYSGGGSSSGSGSGALSAAPAVFGRGEAVVCCGDVGVSAQGSDRRAKPGLTRAISDGCMDITDFL